MSPSSRRRWRTAAAVLAAAGVVTSVVASGPARAGAQEGTGEQWLVEALDLPAAHAISRGGGVVVGVVDTGISPHPDLDSRVLPGHAPGYTDENDPRDGGSGHGTAMAGLIAATGDGQATALGMAPDAQILPVKVQDSGEIRGGNVMLPVGIRWAVDNGASVINLSVGETAANDHLQGAIAYAFDHDVVVVAAAGNAAGGPVQWPAAYPGVVAVSGIGPDGGIWQDADGGSSYGPEIAVAAPASGMRCLVGESPGYDVGYRECRGTSNASAVVAGAVALIRAQFPAMDAADVVNRLIATADQPDGVSERTDEFGFGVINPVAALTADVPTVDANPLGSVSAAGAADDDGSGSDVTTVSDLVSPPVVVGVTVAVLAVAVVAAARSRRAARRAPPPGGPAGGPLWPGP